MDTAHMDSRTAFLRAVMAGDAAQVSALLEREPRLARERSRSGSTALHLAAHYGHRDVAAALIAHGADVNARTLTSPQRTPLLAAVIMNHVELAHLLLDHGADPELGNDMGWRPLHLAALRGHAAMVRVLLAHGASAGAIDGARSTPLTLAARRGHAQVVEILRQVDPDDSAPSAVQRKGKPGQAHAHSGAAARPAVAHASRHTDDAVRT